MTARADLTVWQETAGTCLPFCQSWLTARGYGRHL